MKNLTTTRTSLDLSSTRTLKLVKKKKKLLKGMKQSESNTETSFHKVCALKCLSLYIFMILSNSQYNPIQILLFYLLRFSPKWLKVTVTLFAMSRGNVEIKILLGLQVKRTTEMNRLDYPVSFVCVASLSSWILTREPLHVQADRVWYEGLNVCWCLCAADYSR